ncbi:hypothetical protein FACS1894219_09720 [Clostridia bacterium]|nr:hypothetical protein FACS1894219_09720 [Clostridia bacterium]
MPWSLESPEVRRNSGFMSAEQQQKILDSHISIAGCGGAGYNVALNLARTGVQNFRIADPEVFNLENINRVPGADTTTIGRNKAEVLAEDIFKINPDAHIVTYSDGISYDNATEFSHDADVIFEGIDINRPDLSTAVYRAARELGKAAVTGMEIGRAAITTSFDPDGKFTFEKFLGIRDDTPLDEIRDLPLSSTVPYLPIYEDIETLYAVQKGEISLPSMAESVSLETAMVVNQIARHIAPDKTCPPTWANKWLYVDLGGAIPKSGELTTGHLHYAKTLAFLAIRTALNLNRHSGGYGDLSK